MTLLDRFFDVIPEPGVTLSCEILRCVVERELVINVTIRFCDLNRHEMGYVEIEEWTRIESIRAEVAESYLKGNYRKA